MRVILDPGHWTPEDPGAVGPNGLKESEVAMQICVKAQALLPGHEVKLTHLNDPDDTDANELWPRVERGIDFNADIFVSVHCNAAENPEAEGFETFVLTDTDTSDNLQRAIHSAYMDEFPGAVDRGMKQAEFAVLRGPFPSVLIETEFISNADGEAFLFHNTDRIAKAIASGIVNYFGEL